MNNEQFNTNMPTVQKAQMKQNYTVDNRKPVHKNMNMTQVISISSSVNGPPKNNNFKQNSTKNSAQF